MKEPEMIEGPEAAKRFDSLVRRVIAVPHADIAKRVEEHKRKAALNPNRPGPKPKVKPSA